MKKDTFSVLTEFSKSNARNQPVSGTIKAIKGDRVDVTVRGISTILRNVPITGVPADTGQVVSIAWERGMPHAFITGATGTPGLPGAAGFAMVADAEAYTGDEESEAGEGEVIDVPIDPDPLTPTTSLWEVIIGDQEVVANHSYLCNLDTLITVTLPTTAVVGDVIRVAGMNTGLWKIAQPDGAAIYFGRKNSTVGPDGYLASISSHDAVELVCIVVDSDPDVVGSNEWLVVSAVGNITVA